MRVTPIENLMDMEEPTPQYPSQYPQPNQMYSTTTTTYKPEADPLDVHCMTIAYHVENCPVCSRLYREQHRWYMGLILLLVILLVLSTSYNRGSSRSL